MTSPEGLRAANAEIALVGGFPPPLNGAAKNNQLLYAELVSSGHAVRRLDVAGPTTSLRRTGRYHLARLVRVFIALASLATAGGRALYIVPDGGFGVWYSLAIICVAKLRFRTQIIHHRTFRYIDRPTKAMALITALTKRSGTHVFLSEGMKNRFESAYGSTRHVVCSNALYVREQLTTSVATVERARVRLGHLSNLCRAKGYYDVVDTFESLRRARVDCELHLAGPAVEAGVVTSIELLKTRHGDRFHYAGPLVGEAKSAFYRSLDVFLFPTNYPEEAAPNVIFEAFAAGVPVLTKRRGCIAEIVTGGSLGQAFDLGSDFPSLAAETIQKMAFDSATRFQRAQAIRVQLDLDVRHSIAQHQRLIYLITDGPAG